ncbi:MAG: efflux RND transporter permease subunit [Bacteroidales bacterium]|nr:efflux RND transporter permease subunit [Bacteroidales bacterium]
MIGKLIERPIAVTMCIIAILVLGGVAIGMLPVSLMPNVDIPQITIQVTSKGSSARELDQNVMKRLRREMIQIPGLKEITCEANNGGGTIFMQFEHNTNIDYSFIEINERVDRAVSSFPKDMERPKVIKASATDIPVFFIDITSENQSVESFLELSRFAKEVISKRIEQIPQVAMVDVSGVLGSRYIIEPDNAKMKSLGITIDDLENAIDNNNITLGNLSIKDGHYQWNIRFDSEVNDIEDIKNIYLNIHGRLYLIKDIANIVEEPAPAAGMVRSNGRRAVTFAVIKQSDARMSDLKVELDKLMASFNVEYPEVTFNVTRNQTELLDYSIDNLKSNIIVGAILAILVIFLFLKDFRSPLLISITIPLALVVSLLLMYLVGITINIISLSGLILGIGMMVDNSIIVIDNITQRRERGNDLTTAIVKGTNEVFSPMLSSVLTTCSVFVPLIFLSGIAGALFYDQAMAVAIGLFASLFVAVLAIPVYYRFLYKKNPELKENKYLKKIQIDYDAVYEKGLKWVFRHQKLSWCIFLSFIPLTILTYIVIDKSKLPPLTHTECVVEIDWNSPLNLEVSDARITEFLDHFRENIVESNVLVGTQDFLLSHTSAIEKSQAIVYIKATSAHVLEKMEKDMLEYLTNRYPYGTFGIKQATNIFNLIFSENEPDLVAMIKPRDGSSLNPDELNKFLGEIGKEMPDLYLEPVLWQEQIMFVTNQERMALYNIKENQIHSALSSATRENTMFSIKNGSFSIPVVFADSDGSANNLLSLKIRSVTDNGDVRYVPLSYLVTEKRVRDLKSVVSGKDDNYYPLNIFASDKDVPTIVSTINNLAKADGKYTVTYKGAYYSSRELINELVMVLVVSLLLLFFILAAQFESVVQPFIILSEILVDLFGALFLLWICGSGINLMSLIGIVVMCGIIINDSILKVDTINSLRRQGYGLLRAVMLAGNRRLKPIIMTSLTTILAIAPFLVRGDMGSDLQYPLSVALIGGMILGTIVSVFFIPILYYEIYRKRK